MSSLLVVVGPSARVSWTEAVTHRIVSEVHRGPFVVGVLAVDRDTPALRSALSRIDGLVVVAADPVAAGGLADRLATAGAEALTGVAALVVAGPAVSSCVPAQRRSAASHAARLSAVLRDLGAGHVLPEVVVGPGGRDRLALALEALTDMVGARALAT